MMPFDFKNPITSDSSLMLKDVAWGSEQPPKVVVPDQVTDVLELIPVGFAMQNGQEIEVQDADHKQIAQVEETAVPDLVIQNDEKPPKLQEAERILQEANHENSKKRPGRPKGSKKITQRPKNQQHSTKRTRRSIKGHFATPPGWIIEERAREKGKTAGQIDKTYIAPGTGYRFRSRPELVAHLECLKKTQEENKPGMEQPAVHLDVE